MVSVGRKNTLLLTQEVGMESSMSPGLVLPPCDSSLVLFPAFRPGFTTSQSDPRLEVFLQTRRCDSAKDSALLEVASCSPPFQVVTEPLRFAVFHKEEGRKLLLIANTAIRSAN